MEIHNQIFYTTLCSCILSLTGWFKKFSEFRIEHYILSNCHTHLIEVLH